MSLSRKAAVGADREATMMETRVRLPIGEFPEEDPWVKKIIADPRAAMLRATEEGSGCDTLIGSYVTNRLQMGYPFISFPDSLQKACEDRFGIQIDNEFAGYHMSLKCNAATELAIASALSYELQYQSDQMDMGDPRPNQLGELLQMTTWPGLPGQTMLRQFAQMDLWDVRRALIGKDDYWTSWNTTEGMKLREQDGRIAHAAMYGIANGFQTNHDHLFDHFVGLHTHQVRELIKHNWSPTAFFYRYCGSLPVGLATVLFRGGLCKKHPEKGQDVLQWMVEKLAAVADMPQDVAALPAWNAQFMPPFNDDDIAEFWRMRRYLAAFSVTKGDTHRSQPWQEKLDEKMRRLEAEQERATRERTTFFRAQCIRVLTDEPGQVNTNVFRTLWKTSTSAQIRRSANIFANRMRKELSPSAFKELVAFNKLHTTDTLWAQQAVLVGRTIELDGKNKNERVKEKDVQIPRAQGIIPLSTKGFQELIQTLAIFLPEDDPETSQLCAKILNRYRTTAQADTLTFHEIEPPALRTVDTQLTETQQRMKDFVCDTLSGKESAFSHRENIKLHSLLLTPEMSRVANVVAEGWREIAMIDAVDDTELGKNLDARKPRQQLRVKLGAEKYAKDLDILRRLEAYDELALCENAIVQEIVAEVRKFHTLHERHPRNSKYTPMERCMPKAAKEERRLHCFTGTWLTAAMMVECGIPWKQIFFCWIHKAPGIKDGSHCALLFTDVLKNLKVVDPGFGRVRENFLVGECDSDDIGAQLKELLGGMQQEAVDVRLKRQWADSHTLPYEMQVMPLSEGIASTSMLNIGILHEQKGEDDEALHAFELGLGFNPHSPELLYHLGTLASRRSQTDFARECFFDSLSHATNYLWAHFGLGEIHYKKGDYLQAQMHLRHIKRSGERKIWGDAGGNMRRRALYILKKIEKKLASTKH